MERDAFLATVRHAAAAAPLPGSPPPPRPAPPRVEDLVAEFARNLTAVDGIVHRPAAVDDVAPLVLDILQDAAAASFISWDAAELPVPVVVGTLEAAGLKRRPATVPRDPAERLAHQTDYFDIAAGVTGAHAGFAVSGSIVLTSGRGRPRMASLIPDLHVALLRHDAITTTVSAWLAANRAVAAGTRNLIFITGPSRTGDIEMKLNLGVHGPRRIHVVLVPGP